MSKFPNVLIFKQRPSTGSAADYQIGAAVTSWLTYVMGTTRNRNTGDFHAQVVGNPPEYRAGVTYFKWLKMGVLIHVGGFDYANHYVKLPNSWKALTYETLTGITDEKGDAVADVVVTNEEHYEVKHTNKTDCLVKIVDANFAELGKLINYDKDANATNVLSEVVYFAALKEGGEFYVAPKIETEI